LIAGDVLCSASDATSPIDRAALQQYQAPSQQQQYGQPPPQQQQAR
jgi:hypothetical protein